MTSRFLPVTAALVLLFSCASAPGVPPEVLAAEYYNLGNAYFQLKKYKEAGEYYQKALSYDRNNTQALYNLARSLAEQGQWTDAGSRLQTLKEKDPDNLLVLKTMAYLKYLEKDKDATLEHYRQVISAGGADQETWRNAGLVAWEVGDKDSAMEYLENFRKGGGTEPGILVILGGLMLSAGKDLEGAELLSVQKEALGADGEAALSLVKAWIRLKQYDQALSAYELLHAADQKKGTKRPEVWFEAGSLVWTELQDPNKALDFFRRALDQGFSDSVVLRTLLDRNDLVRRDAVAALFREKGLPKEEAADGTP